MFGSKSESRFKGKPNDCNNNLYGMTASEDTQDSGLESLEATPSLRTEGFDLDINSLPPTLELQLEMAKKIMGRFFDNRFEEGLEIAARFEDVSIPASHSKAVIVFFHAILTLELPVIEAAKKVLKQNLRFMSARRKKGSLRDNITGLFWRIDCNQYTEEEALVEAHYAESQVMMALLTFFGEQSLMTLVKGALRLTSSNASTNLCVQIMNYKNNWKSDYIKKVFENNTKTISGTSNLILSHLPASILKVLSLISVYGERRKGIEYLESVTAAKDDIRYPVAAFIVMGYNLYMEQMFGIGAGDLDWSERLASDLRQRHPQSAFFLFFAARVMQVRGRPKEAIALFNKCINVQCSWKQIDNIAYWDICWCYAIQGEWEKAFEYAQLLSEQCKWSPVTNLYQMASFKYMLMTDKSYQPSLKEVISQNMRNVPGLRIRRAGKTVTFEKFAIERSKKYFEKKETLTLPALELFYVWNIFATSAGNPLILNPILKLIESKLDEARGESNNRPDDYCLLLLLRGVCLKYLLPQEALNCFREIVEMDKKLEKGSYIAPHAALELGLTYLKLQKMKEAKHWLERARNEYKGYLIEVNVQLRAHSALRQIKEMRTTPS